MDSNFNDNLEMAINRCNGVMDSRWQAFYNIYPFATENINGYINHFLLNDQSLLTVGSSGDQIINAALHNCKDITLLDTNPYTKYYYYLKAACILCLEKKELLSFLRYKDFPTASINNNNAFNIQTYEKIKETLKSLDYESYLFWEELFQTIEPIKIRENLFTHDEGRTIEITGCNDYLQNNDSYNNAKIKIKNINPKFICGDLFKTKLERKYDNIWLSNIGTYLSNPELAAMVYLMADHLSEHSQLLISYLYETTENTRFNIDFKNIYNLNNTFELLKQFNPQIISFIGTNGLKYKNKNIRDSILVYRKK